MKHLLDFLAKNGGSVTITARKEQGVFVFVYEGPEIQKARLHWDGEFPLDEALKTFVLALEGKCSHS